MPKLGQKLIKWTKGESKSMVDEVKRIYREEENNSLYHRTHISILQEAQENVLMPDRRKTLLSIQAHNKDLSKKSILTTLKLEEAFPQSTSTSLTTELEKVLDTPINTEFVNDPEPKEKEKEMLVSNPFTFTISPKAIERMVEKGITDRINEEFNTLNLGEKLQQAMDSLMLRIGDKLSADLTSTEALLLDLVENKSLGKKKVEIKTPGTLEGPHYKIAVCGLNNDQARHLKEGLKGFDLQICVHTSDVKSYTVNPHSNKVFIMTKFFNHSQKDNIERVFSSNDIVYCNGGMHALKHLIVKTMYPSYYERTNSFYRLHFN